MSASAEEQVAAPGGGAMSSESWLAAESISVTAAVQVIAVQPPPASQAQPCAAAAAPPAAAGAGAGAGAAPTAAPLRLRLRGQVCRKRHLSKNLMFLTLRQAESCADWDATAPRVQTIAKLQSLGAEQMSEIKRLVKLGDMMQIEGTVHTGTMGPEVQLERCAVVERWAVSCRGTGFKPDIEPPSDTSGGAAATAAAATAAAATAAAAAAAAAGDAVLGCGDDSAPLCKFWVNTGVCKRVGCRFSHGKPDDKRSWKEIRTEWQRERR
jgi:hypothetical protein